MPGLLDVYTRRAQSIATALRALDDGTETSVSFQGVSYVEATRDELDRLYDLNCYLAAREGILAGGQMVMVLGRQFMKANLAEIERQIQRLEGITARAARGGIRLSQGVPVA